MLNIPQQVIDEGKNYREKVEDFKKGFLETARFKPYRVSLGVYEQRDNDTYMLRTRIPCGVINLNQFKKISELAKAYSHGYIHFTTRQDIQFHKVTLDDTVNIMEGLLEAGIVTKGTGGNTARNVACSPLAGVSQDDVFDVTPYALATTEYALKDPTIFNLPRKYKISYSNSPADTANATISDLGFVAKTENGEKGFEVYGAGGLGGSPGVAVKLADFIPASEVLFHVQAMKELFENEGDRTNKHKARIRHILQRLGEKEFKAGYQKSLQIVKSNRSLELFLPEGNTGKQSGDSIISFNPLITGQKEDGLYSVYVHPQNGNLRAENLDLILDFLAGLDYEPVVRLTNTQGFFVRDLKGSHAKELADLILNFGSSFAIDNSVACAGASTCKQGLGLSQNLLSAIRERFLNADENIKSQLPRIFISGCPNSCGQHHKGEIGLYGKAKRTADGLVPMYAILFGGAVGVGKAVLGTEFGTIPAKKVPEFIYQLAVLKTSSGISSFYRFVTNEIKAVKSLIERFSVIEPEAENPDLYYDFGSGEKFSIKGRGPGECSAGVLDVIKLDISNSQFCLNDFQTTRQSEKLYEAGLSAARALLILKGVDTTKDRLIFNEFGKHFIDTGYVKESIKSVFECLLDFKLGDLDSLENRYEEIKYLADRVVKMYESLSPKLEITLPKEPRPENLPDSVQPDAAAPLKVIDLKGVKCPINFVKAKIELSKIQTGEKIAFQLDDGEPINNVPRSIQLEGHEVLKISENFDGYNLLIVRKK